jgi:hypothetical protein
VTAYTTAANIAAYLGVTLTAGQQTQAGICAQAASDWIDVYKARSWQDDGTVADELHVPVGDRVYLNNRPVTAVSAVSTRQRIVGADWNLLDSSEYELLDATNGVLLISGWADPGLDVKASYTHTATAPPSQIALAATIIAASLLGPTLRPNTSGLESVSVGQNDVAVKFSVDYGSVPSEAMALLGARGLVVA